MKYAEVAVHAPSAWPRTFTYSLSADLSISIGSAVWVPFGKRLLQGIVFNLTDFAPVEEIRPIAEVIGAHPLLTPQQIELARWISQHYLSPLFESAALMLPPGFERRTLTFLQAIPDIPPDVSGMISPVQQQVLLFVQENGRVNTRQLKGIVPQKQLKATLDQLARKGLIAKTTELEHTRIKPKMVTVIRLAIAPEETATAIDDLRRKRAIKQAELLEFLASRTAGPIALSELREKFPSTPALAAVLAQKGLITVEQLRLQRDPLAHRNFPIIPPPQLTAQQESVWNEIRRSIETKSSPSVFLLHGITGSGKTEIYLRALEQTIALGKKGIVLVPEIALTPQTIARFAARFPGRVAVIHSKLSPGEQFDEWHRIRDGEFDVVIGSRSALFAPQPDLGLIVIDEEHEWTYKQHEKPPLYHARDTALKLAEIVGAVVILGSATPDLESYHRAHRGDFCLLELPDRVGEIHNGAFPTLSTTEIIDLRHELKTGNRSIFSRKLARSIDDALTAGEQVILFLNRRGTASFVQCRDCGHVMRCRRCEIPLTYHAPEEKLICHQCNYRTAPPAICPECQSRRIKFMGIGTEKVEEETALAFPKARLLRWDRDVTKGKNAHEEILRKFQSHEADILIGTQMIAKGLDIPLVTLVGVINADVSLHLPYYRAGERTFQIISQVAGRAGRGRRPGHVIIQTYTPDHYAILAAAKQDYAAFYEKEITLRQQYGNPPFNRLATLVYTNTNLARCQQEAEKMARLLRTERDSQGLANVAVLGPVPAYVQRLRGRYRWQVIVRSPDPLAILAKITIPFGWAVDVDPVGLS